MRSTAAAMSPRRKGSWPGSSAARNRRASCGSASPRRTRTEAVTSLTPSSLRSTAAACESYGAIVQAPVTTKDGTGAAGRPQQLARPLRGRGARCYINPPSSPTASPDGVGDDLHPEKDDRDRGADDDHGDRRHECHLLERVLRDGCAHEPDREHDNGHHDP